MGCYSLGEEVGDDLFVVLYKGAPTDALASEKVVFSDKVVVYGGMFLGGTFHDGMFLDGIFWRGIFHDGIFLGGTFHDGTFHGGTFRGGTFHGGTFRGGTFHGGTFHDGTFHGGTFRGGTFHGGTFRRGIFHGGSFLDRWLPIQIQGSRDFINCPDGENIMIGCKRYSPEKWKETYKTVGEKNGYTKEQIAEYKIYIDLVANLIEQQSGAKK